MLHKLTGRLDMDSCGELAITLTATLRPQQSLTLDFAEVNSADSAALALILQCQREAAALGASLELANLPAELDSLARLYGIESLLLQNQKADE